MEARGHAKEPPRKSGRVRRFLLKLPLAAGILSCAMLDSDGRRDEWARQPLAHPIKLQALQEPEYVIAIRPERVLEKPEEPEPEAPIKAGPGCIDNMCILAKKGYRRIAETISFLTRDYRSNKLTYDEANRAAGYVLSDLRRMRNARRLMIFLPETSVELLRCAHERGVTEKEAERMAYYLYRIVTWVKMRGRRDFDEYMAHLVGREWREMKKHPQPGFTWQAEAGFYSKHGVPDLKSAVHLHRFLKTERYRKHFKERFNFYGRHPPEP